MDYDLLGKQFDYNKQKEIERKNERDKSILMDYVRERMKTSMIRNLETFEKDFSYLWGGHDGPTNRNERIFYSLWKKVRTDILDFGNNAIRDVTKELEANNISRKKVTVEYKFKKDLGDE